MRTGPPSARRGSVTGPTTAAGARTRGTARTPHLNQVIKVPSTSNYIELHRSMYIKVQCKINAAFSGYSECRKEEFDCGNGKCIAMRRKCDGNDDCENGRDEAECFGGSEPTFLCCNGEVIGGHQHCDGVRHCRDGSDEFYCQSEGLISGHVM